MTTFIKLAVAALAVLAALCGLDAPQNVTVLWDADDDE